MNKQPNINLTKPLVSSAMIIQRHIEKPLFAITEIEYQLNTIIPFALLFNAYIEIVHVSKQKLEKTNEIELAFKKFVDKQLYPKIHYHLIKNDDIPTGIISHLDANKCDMIIFFTHELSLYERIYNLGISNKVIPFANLPILIIKSF